MNSKKICLRSKLNIKIEILKNIYIFIIINIKYIINAISIFKLFAGS